MGHQSRSCDTNYRRRPGPFRGNQRGTPLSNTSNAVLHGPDPGQKLEGTNVDVVFIGSCTNSRIEDLRAAAAIAKGRRVAKGVRALVVPGSGLVKEMAELEGLDEIFIEAGFEWREAGCSMCLAMNADKLTRGQRCASTSNRNFEGRQGPGGRTHLLSPAMAAARGGDRCIERRTGVALMDKFLAITGIAASMNIENVDTDRILPARFLKTIKRTGLGIHLFESLRYCEDGSENSAFILNQPRFRHAQILIAGPNFGCGSSREHAPWALLDYGIRSVIAPSFADIFHENCFKNGILPIVLPHRVCEALGKDLAQAAIPRLTIDLQAQTVCLPGNAAIAFSIDAFRRDCLMQGLDDIDITMTRAAAIAAYERRATETRAWIPAITVYP